MTIDRVVEVPMGWEVQSESGKVLGHYPTEAEARHRLAQIEYFKHARKDVIVDVPQQSADARCNAVTVSAGFRRMG